VAFLFVGFQQFALYAVEVRRTQQLALDQADFSLDVAVAEFVIAFDDDVFETRVFADDDFQIDAIADLAVDQYLDIREKAQLPEPADRFCVASPGTTSSSPVRMPAVSRTVEASADIFPRPRRRARGSSSGEAAVQDCFPRRAAAEPGGDRD
jgi:hypothetical protein